MVPHAPPPALGTSVPFNPNSRPTAWCRGCVHPDIAADFVSGSTFPPLSPPSLLLLPGLAYMCLLSGDNFLAMRREPCREIRIPTNLLPRVPNPSRLSARVWPSPEWLRAAD